MPLVFHAIRQTCLSGRHGKQKIAVCGLLRSAGLARAPAASRRERARGAKWTASKAWPILENSIWEIFSKVLRFGFAVQIPNYKEYTKQKIAVCGLLRSAGLARAHAASRRERTRGAKRTASKAWPIPENLWRKIGSAQKISIFKGRSASASPSESAEDNPTHINKKNNPLYIIIVSGDRISVAFFVKVS